MGEVMRCHLENLFVLSLGLDDRNVRYIEFLPFKIVLENDHLVLIFKVGDR
jgi:hypothetical protein